MKKILALLTATLILIAVLACEKNLFSDSSPENSCLKASNSSYRVQERQSFWCYIAWKVDLKNACSHSIDATIIFQFCDKDGFVLGWGIETPVMSGHSTMTVRDLTAVKMSLLPRIHHCVVKLKYR